MTSTSLKVILISLLFFCTQVFAGDIGPHMQRLIKNGKGNFAGGQFAKTFKKQKGGQSETHAHFFIEADPSSKKALKALGVTINTVTKSGIMTATAPVHLMSKVAAVKGVRRIQAGKSVKKMMDQSAASEGVNLPTPTYPRASQTGQGVIVAIIDTGIDIEHADFFDANGNTRILNIWDHTLDSTDVSGTASAPSGFSYGTEWSQSQIQGGYGTCAHRDRDGHGTHVAGTSAGSGLAPAHNGTYPGIAPEAHLLIVKFDFDNEKDRNTDTAILDGINYIMQKADSLGLPVVINMSLGSDFGDKDGTSSEERGIDDLTGPGKIVVVAAGNAGKTYGSANMDLWGAPMHGAGTFSTSNDIVFETSPDLTANSGTGNDYIFWDVWYDGSDQCRVQITPPGSSTSYPPNFNGRNRNVWKTGGTSGGYDTPYGGIYVYNGSATGSGWDTDNGDNNIYIEISDAYGTEVAEGKWVIEFIPLSGTGNYNAFHGNSSNMNKTYLWYNSGSTSHTWGDNANPFLSNNEMTIGVPATAFSVISVGAYQTKNEWPARLYSDWTNPSSSFSLITQAYGTTPLNYYDPFTLYDLASFSSRGPSRDGRTQPFVSAPGVGIVASLSQTVLNDPAESYFRRLNRVEYGGNHATLQGTSMACPNTTGSVALLLEDAKAKGLSPTPDDIKTYLSGGARTDGYTGLTPNNDWGHGKVDVTQSLAFVQAAPLEISTSSLAGGTIGIAYSETLSATGGVPPFTWSLSSGSLPSGLSLNASTGEISGTPTGSGTSNFTVQVLDNDLSSDTQNLSITVSEPAVAPVVNGVSPDQGSKNQRITVVISGSNFEAGATVDFGSQISVQSVTVDSATSITCRIRINKKASSGPRDVTVSNPSGGSDTLSNGFTVL